MIWLVDIPSQLWQWSVVVGFVWTPVQCICSIVAARLLVEIYMLVFLAY